MIVAAPLVSAHSTVAKIVGRGGGAGRCRRRRLLMKRKFHPSALFPWTGVSAAVGMLWLFVAPLAAQQHRSPEGRLADPEAVVVRVELGPDAEQELLDRYEVHGMERITRDRTAWQLVVAPAELDALMERGFDPDVDMEATRSFRERRAASLDRVRDRDDRDRAERSADTVGTALESTTGIPIYPCYRTVEETYDALSDEQPTGLASTHPNLATWLDLGDSLIEDQTPGTGYDIGVLKITDGDFPGPKAPFVILAATHAREYVTAETATRFAEHLVQNFGVDPDVTAFLRHVEVWIMPVHNPDGRKVAEGEYGISGGQRKNLRETCASSSDGVDLNRNSEQYFRHDCMSAGECTSGLGYSTSGCNSLYSGPDWPNDGGEDPEPETVAANDLMAMAFTDQRGEDPEDAAPDTAEGLFLSIHSSGEYVLLPWEARWTDPPNFEGLRTLGRRFGHRLPGYVVCQDCFGTASGTNVDEAYGRFGVASYTFELGTTFHQSCTGSGTTFEDDIWPIALDALLLGLKSARRPYLEPGGPEIHTLSWTTETFLPGEQLFISGVADDTRVDWVNQGDSSASDQAAQPEHDITAVFYSIDLPPWDPSAVLVPLAATDTFDSSVEGFEGFIDTAGLSVGPHVVWLVAEDDEIVDGQMGVASALLIEGDFLFADGFESGGTSAWSP